MLIITYLYNLPDDLLTAAVLGWPLISNPNCYMSSAEWDYLLDVCAKNAANTGVRDKTIPVILDPAIGVTFTWFVFDSYD